MTNMKKIFILTTFCLTLTINTFGQKLTKKEAQQFFDKTLNYLKTGDTTSFVNLWYLDNTQRPYNGKVFTRQNVIEEFNGLKTFLDTALVKNLPFDEIETEKMSNAFYKIKGWFKYNDKYLKGYGFLVYFINNKWVFCYTTETSVLTRA